MAITFEHVACRREGPDLKASVGLDDLNLTIRVGRFVAVLGAPGSGKTTLLQHLNGLLLPDAGAVDILGYRLEGGREPSATAEGRNRLYKESSDVIKTAWRRWLHKGHDGGGSLGGIESGSGSVNGSKSGGEPACRRRRGRKGQTAVPLSLRRHVGLVFQFPEQQLFEATVEHDLRFGPLNFGFSEAAAAEAAHRAADIVGLDEELLGRSPFALSGGQMRKAAIAAVLASDPDILALDEPTSSLDQVSRKELMRLLHEWRSERGKTIVIVTHRLEEVLPYADEYIVMDAGRCVFQGDAAALLAQPDVMARAGVAVPDSAALLAEVSAVFAVEPPASGLDPDGAAAWIEQLLDDGGGSLQQSRS